VGWQLSQILDCVVLASAEEGLPSSIGAVIGRPFVAIFSPVMEPRRALPSPYQQLEMEEFGWALGAEMILERIPGQL